MIGARRLAVGLVSTLCVLVLASALALAAGDAIAAACPNESVRAQQGTEHLPDCRAYEMVSPVDKNGGDIRGIDGVSGGGVVQASADGSKITYVSLASFGEARGAPLASQYVSERLPGQGWLTQNITLETNAQVYALAGAGTPYEAFSSDLSAGLMFGGVRTVRSVEGGVRGYPVETPPLAGAPAGYENYYLRELSAVPETGEPHLKTLLTSAPDVSPSEFRLRSSSVRPLILDMSLS